MRKRINNDFDALVEVLHEGVKIDLSLYEITGVRMVSNQAYKVTDYEIRNGSLFLHVTPLIVPKIGRYKIVVTYRMADPTLADGFWNFEFDKYLVTIVGSSEEEDAGEVVITADAVIGMQGKSAYQVWLDAGNTGTVEDFLEWIQSPANEVIASIQEVENIALYNETLRATAEGLRVTAETNRNNAEGLRLSAEVIRNDNEADRIEAEGLRAGAETGRQTAEGLRVQAELNRQTNTSTAISNAEQATDDANDAALLANEKAGLANEKALLADEKAELAETATTQANDARDGANDAAESATNLVNSYATDLAAKELKANKQNSLAVDGTGTKFPTVDAVNEGLAGNTNLLSTYVHSGNKEVYVTSIDYATNTFFKTNHGLVNDDIIAVKILDYNAIEAILPIKNNTSGNVSGYRVVNASADTFQISLTSGGAAIVLVNKAGIDLTKWRFEVVPTDMIFTFTNVNNGNCTIEIYGDLSRVPRYPLANNYTGYNSLQSSFGAIPHDIGNVFMCLYTITYRNNNGIITINRKWNGIQLNSADATKITFISGEIFQIPKRDSYSNINNIHLMTAHITNGTVIKVWKL